MYDLTQPSSPHRLWTYVKPIKYFFSFFSFHLVNFTKMTNKETKVA